jgi:ABC-type uncharacterized transport system permease subunit
MGAALAIIMMIIVTVVALIYMWGARKATDRIA